MTNQRSSFRVNDKVALKVEQLEGGDAKEISEVFEAHHKGLGLLNHFVNERQKRRPNFIKIEKQHPEISRYITYLEDQIQALIQQNDQDSSTLPNTATHAVSISASGMSCDLETHLPEEALVEITVRLFPSMATIFCFGRILRCESIEGVQPPHWETAIKFTHMHEDDEERLVKHIHKIQMNELRLMVN
ncbi:MAG TPA: PilZ domain-containing protein [Gammaproteobacteria bacterium]|nr:PilZ domain-containing protein [Gammaproteobacteria bacterium]